MKQGNNYVAGLIFLRRPATPVLAGSQHVAFCRCRSADFLKTCNAGDNHGDIDHVADMQINDTLTRKELVTMNVAKQREIFNCLAPEAKCALYRYKICKDLESGNFTRAEYKEMKRLLDKVVPEIYTTRQEQFNKFGDKFEKKMIKEYGWNDEKLFKYTMVIMTASEYEDYMSAVNLNLDGID